jgi:hypothetical protein
MPMFEDFDVLSFVRLRLLNCIGHVTRMDSTRKVKYLTIIIREVDLEEDQITDGGSEYKHINKRRITHLKEKSKNTADREKSIMEAKVRVGL